jgi:hypothetical protein
MQLTPTSHNGKQTQALQLDVAALRDDLLSEKITVKPVFAGELSEAFALLDPDLAFLHKDMKSAAAQLMIAQKSGQLVDMAQWRFDSAESAYKTRLMEVRKNKELKKYAKKLLKDGEVEAKREMRNSSMQEEMNKSFALRRKQKAEEKRRKKEQEGGFLFYFLLGMWLAQINAQQRARDLKMTNLQNDFFNARTGTV